MSYAIYKGEKNMSELVSRLFGLQGKGTQSAIKQAADALLKTNPQLKDFSKVAVGSVIAVPGTAPPLQSAVQANEFTVMRSSAVMSAQQAFGGGRRVNFFGFNPFDHHALAIGESAMA